MALPAVLLDSALCLPRVLFFFRQIDNEVVRALHSEENRYGMTDAGISACYNCPHVGELAGSFVKLIAAIFSGDVFAFGLGVELGFPSLGVLGAELQVGDLEVI